MVISIDLDHTTFDDPLLTSLFKKYGIRDLGTVSWGLEGMPEELVQEARASWLDPKRMGNLKLLPGALDKIKSWVGSGHEVNIVTARDLSIEAETVALVDRELGGLITNTLVVGPHTNKLPHLINLSTDCWVDDSAQQVQKCLQWGMNSILITNSNTPWNWEYAKNNPSVRRNDSLASVSELI